MRKVQKGAARYEREHAIILPTVFRTSFLLRVSPERDPSEKTEVARLQMQTPKSVHQNLKVTQHEQQCCSAATVEGPFKPAKSLAKVVRLAGVDQCASLLRGPKLCSRTYTQMHIPEKWMFRTGPRNIPRVTEHL